MSLTLRELPRPSTKKELSWVLYNSGQIRQATFILRHSCAKGSNQMKEHFFCFNWPYRARRCSETTPSSSVGKWLKWCQVCEFSSILLRCICEWDKLLTDNKDKDMMRKYKQREQGAFTLLTYATGGWTLIRSRNITEIVGTDMLFNLWKRKFA